VSKALEVLPTFAHRASGTALDNEVDQQADSFHSRLQKRKSPDDADLSASNGPAPYLKKKVPSDRSGARISDRWDTLDQILPELELCIYEKDWHSRYEFESPRRWAEYMQALLSPLPPRLALQASRDAIT